MISNFAETQKMSTGADPLASATTAVELAHLYGQYDARVGKNGPGVNYMVDLAGKAMSVSPGTQKSFLTTLSQMSGQMRPLYGSNRAGFINDSVALTMLEAQLGQTGRGGTQIASMIGRTLGAGSTAFGSRTSTQNKDLHDLTALANQGGGHLSFFNSQGQFGGMSQFLQILEKAAAAPGESPERIGALFRGAFGAVGLRQAGILADPITVAQFGKIGQYLGPTGVVDTAKQRDAYNATPTGQAAKLASDWSTVSTLVGQAYVPAMATSLGVLAGALGTVANFMSDHPGMTQLLSWAAAATVGLTTLSGVVLAVKGATMLWGAASEALGLAKVAEGIGFVTTALRTQGVAAVVSAGATRAWALAQAAGGVVAGAASAAYGVLDGVVIALSGGFDIATISAAAFDVAASPVIAIVGGVVLAVGAAVLVFKNWSTVSGVLGTMLGWLGGKLHDFLVLVGQAHQTNSAAKAAGAPALAGATIPTQTGAAHEQTINGQRGHFQPGYRGAQVWVPDPVKPPVHHKGGGGGGGVVTHNHGPVTFHIHQQPGQSTAELADAIWARISNQTGLDSRRQGSSNVGWDLGYGGV